MKDVIANPITELHSAFIRGEYSLVVEKAENLCAKNPANGAALHLMGAALLALSDGAGARRCLETAARFLPASADLWDHLCAALTLCKEYDEAQKCCEKSLKLQPGRVHALMNGAKNSQAKGDERLVLEYADRLIAAGGAGIAVGLRHRADALRRLGRKEESLAACEELLLLYPGEGEILTAAARLASDLGRLQQTLEFCDRGLVISPENLDLYSLKSKALQSTGRLKESIELIEGIMPLAESKKIPGAFSTLAFNYMYLPQRTVEQNLLHARRFGALAASLAKPYEYWSCIPDPDRPLTVGLVTGDLRRHPIGHFLCDVMSVLAGSSISIMVYDTANKPDDMTARIRPLATGWRDVSTLDDEACAALIHDDRIDILVDLAGHSASNRLTMMARKPAPVQLSWAGYLGTTGTPGIDYVLADPYSVPEGAENEFSEKVRRLPEATYCFTIPLEKVPVVQPPAIQNGYITFGSCNNPDKFNDSVYALWGRVLEAVPGSRMLLKGRQWSFPEYVEASRKRMAEAGLDPARVDTEGPSKERPFASYNRMDITLDPFPYSGGTSTVEALWTGVPVLAMKGDRMVWRMGESFLAAAGLMDWLANDPDSYVALAAKKAADIKGLAALREVQRQQVESSILFDPKRFARHLEEALRGIWQEWCSGSSGAEQKLKFISNALKNTN